MKELPKRTKTKNTSTSIALTNALNTIYKSSNDSCLNPSLFVDLKDEIKIVSDYLKCSKDEALIFANICSINMFGDSVGVNDLYRHFEMTPFELIPHMEFINNLCDRYILIRKKNNRRNSQDNLLKYQYEVNSKIIEAIVLNKPFPLDLLMEVNNEIDVLEKIFELCCDCTDEKIDCEDLLVEVDELINKNKDFPLVKHLSLLEIESKDRVLYAYLIWKSLNGSHHVDMDDLINYLFKRTSKRLIYMQSFYQGENKLIREDLISYSSGKFFNDVDFSLTDHSIQTLEKYKLTFNFQTKNKGTISPSDIVSKSLFYEKEEQIQIDKISKMMEEENYKVLMDRLSIKGLPQNLSVLLFGAPGTGKTETVLQLAKNTGREIMKVEISQSKSMWFGESEKMIKKIFKDYANLAKTTKITPILMFNEADAILSKRKGNNASAVSQTENAMQNILLEEMENFKGIFIATTNLAENLDKAFDRRFLFKVLFNKPTKDALASIWMSKMPKLSLEEAHKLSERYQLTGGQIDNILRKSEIQELMNGTICVLEDLLAFCAQEIILQKGTQSIGFGRS